MATLEELFSIGTLNECTLECTRQSRWKETTQRYIANMLINNLDLMQDVLSGNYRVNPTVDFRINERGHIRQIEAPVVRDRVVQKTITKGVLFPLLSRCLIYDNYASLPKRGTAFARKRFEVMLKRYIAKNGTDGYVMLIDIKKYFESIDHDILKELVYPYIKSEPTNVIDLIWYIIDTSSKSNKGLNLGSEAPQILAIFYLNKVDTFVKIVKSVKYYGRYMDDMFIIGKDKNELKSLLDEIESVLESLKLLINKKKTHIVKLTHGFTYLQVKYTVSSSGKITKRPTRKKIARERRRLKAFSRMLDSGRMTKEEICNCYLSWRGTLVKDHNAYAKSIQSMDSLYKSLFQDTVDKGNKSRNTMINDALKDARELKHLI